MSIRSAACALLAVTTIAAAGCGADEDPPLTVDAAVGPDGAAGVDGALAIDAVPGPDADPSLEPALTAVPCDAPSAMIEYYSCAFFIGGGSLRVGDVVQFVGCEGHTVRSAAGVALATSPAGACYQATSAGTLSYACQQHPGNSGSIVVAP